MNEYEAIIPVIYRLLTPNETLDVRLFDFRGKMHPEVRRQLLANAKYVINRTIGGIDGLSVKDVYLNGSSAGYFYREESDIDIRIEVHNESCRYLSKDDDDLSAFLAVMSRGNCGNLKFTLGTRFVDITLKASGGEIIGLYSVLRDRWEIRPDKHFADNLRRDDIQQKYFERHRNIQEYLHKLQVNGKLWQKEGIREAEEYYRSLFSLSLSSPDNYVVHKLLSYQGVFKEIRKTVSDAWKDYLSLK